MRGDLRGEEKTNENFDEPIIPRLKWKERIDNYSETFPQFPLGLMECGGRLVGVWFLGADYHSLSGYHGSYPPNYFRRIAAMFPEVYSPDCLHLFSGSLTREDVRFAKRLDRCDYYKPDYLGRFDDVKFDRSFKIIVTDPPYTHEDANTYGDCMINRPKTLARCYDILEPGGLILWLDMVWVMFSKQKFELIGAINVIRSTGHRVRDVFIYQKVGGQFPRFAKTVPSLSTFGGKK